MNNKTIKSLCLTVMIMSATTVLNSVSASSIAKEISHVTINVKDCPDIKHLVIYKPGQDPKNSPYQILTDGNSTVTYEIESDYVEKYNIIDFGEILEKNRTSRYADFIMDPGTDIDVTVGSEGISVYSTGKEFNAWNAAMKLADETFGPRMDKAAGIADSAERENEMGVIMKDRADWLMDYYKSHPMIGFALELSDRINSYNVSDSDLGTMLTIYHDNNYKNLYPGHPVHGKIAAAEKLGYQICGGDYHDFDALTPEGDTVRMSDYMAPGRMTLVVFWATWCVPCRKEVLELASSFGRYKDMGVDIIGMAREFGSADDIRCALEQDKHPWPTLLDLDDRFNIFNRHGLTSSGFYLIDKNGKIIAASYFIDDINSKLQSVI